MEEPRPICGCCGKPKARSGRKSDGTQKYKCSTKKAANDKAYKDGLVAKGVCRNHPSRSVEYGTKCQECVEYDKAYEAKYKRPYGTPEYRMQYNKLQRARRLRASIEIKTRQLKEMFDEEEI